MLELPRERRHGLLEAQLPHELSAVADDEPLSMIEHLHQLAGAFLHLAERVEQDAPLGHRGRGDEQVDQHLHAARARTLQGEDRVAPVLGHAHEMGQPLQHRLRIDALERDPVVTPRVAPARHPLEAPRDAGDERQHLLELAGLERGLDLTNQRVEQPADVRRLGVALELTQHVVALGRHARRRAGDAGRRRDVGDGDRDVVDARVAEPGRNVLRTEGRLIG